MIKSRRDQPAEDTRSVERVREALEGYLAEHGPKVSVPVAHVLDLLSPRGLWRFDPDRGRAGTAAEHPAALPPGIDPITGCRPVTAPGATPD